MTHASSTGRPSGATGPGPEVLPFTDLTEASARREDDRDPLRAARALFHIPPASCVTGRSEDAHESIYLAGNSLGCQPRGVRAAIEQELLDWERLGVEGHIHGRHPWLPYHEELRASAARLVGALPAEVVVMNSLTVNLHLLMASFYRPTRERFKIVIEDSCFPSDSYAVQSQAAFHAPLAGFDAQHAIIRLRPRAGEETLRTEDAIAEINRHGPSVALVMLGGVNYLTGQWFDMPAITRAAHAAGAKVGWDLAHAAGNVPLDLHGLGADFAAWCSYKFLNGGPGALAGVFVHERHLADRSLPQFAGWWGVDPATRFRMGPDFVPVASADRYQLSNPPIFSMTPVRVSLEIFDRFGMAALRAKSRRLTAYLEALLDAIPGRPARSITPRDPEQRGAALSLVFAKGAKEAMDELKRAGVVCDFREPNVIRAAPVPLYTSFHDVWCFAEILRRTFAS
ncbi:MAG: kynureninase [Phycisphaerales bacterium]